MFFFSVFNMFVKCLIVLCVVFIGSTTGRGGLHSEESAPPARVQQCREGCLEQFATEDFACLQGPECSMCWDQCAAPSNKINTSILDTWPLKIISMIRQGSLVSAEISWPTSNSPTQCLVTWEISGGGLMGNLLTDSSNVELSLWPETKYKIQVTCKNKVTEAMTRSLLLTLDTSEAVTVPNVSTTIKSIQNSDISTTTNSPQIDQNENIIIDNNNLNYDDDLSTSLLNNKIHNLHLKNNLWKVTSSRYEMIFGILTAFLVFSVIILLILLNLKKTKSSEKVSLIDNEVSNEIQTTSTLHV